jgi:hypothetical protein
MHTENSDNERDEDAVKRMRRVREEEKESRCRWAAE